MCNILIFKDGEIELPVTLKKETVWLTQKQIAELFGVQKAAISKHLKNIFTTDELDEESTVSKMETVQKEGNRVVKRVLDYYNLDAIIAVGYRVNSKKATKFRQWATKVLKEYIYNGYAINREKITQMRIANLEKDVEFIKSQIENNTLEFKQGIFFAKKSEVL